MSEALDPVLPQSLRELLESDDLGAHEGFTFLLLTIRHDGWPHLAMLSVGEIVALDERRLNIALWERSTTTANLNPAGLATLACVLDNASYSLRLNLTRAGELPGPRGEPLVHFSAWVEAAQVDSAPYAVLESGVRHRLKQPAETVANWTELRALLRDPPLAYP